MARVGVTWHGSDAELLELSRCVDRHCTCPPLTGLRPRVLCAAHEMLFGDQRAVDGLLFAHRIAGRLRLEEWRPDEAQPSPGAAEPSGRAGDL